MKTILLICMCASMMMAQLFTRDSMSEVVKDYNNNLMWVDNKNTITLQMTHKEALNFCETLVYSGYANWRVPTIEEFQTIVDKSNKKSYINKAFKFNVPTGYWALKAHFRTFWYYADYMNFISGTAYFDNRKVNKYVRCVRDIK